MHGNIEFLTICRGLNDGILAQMPPARYDIHTDIPFPALQLVDAGELADNAPSKWWYQSRPASTTPSTHWAIFEGGVPLGTVDRRGCSTFIIIEGRLLIDLDPVGGESAAMLDGGRSAVPGRTVALGPRQGLLVPRGVLHRTRAPERTVVLMFEAATVTPTGD